MNVARTTIALVAIRLVSSGLSAAGSAPAASAQEAPTMVVHPQPSLAHATAIYTVIVPGQTDEDRRVDALLDTPLPAGGFTFEGKSLNDLASLLRDRLGIDVTLEAQSLEGFGHDDLLLSGASSGTTYRQMLRACLRRVNSTFSIGDGSVVIMTKEKAAEHQVITIYPVPTDCAPTELCDLIQRVVQPTTWDVQGGAGSISFVTQANALVVSQTKDVHEELLDLLRSGFDRDLGPTRAAAEGDQQPRAVRAHAIPDAAMRRELEETLVDLCNAHLGPDADPSARVRTVGELLLVESSSRPFQVHATEIIRAIVGIEVAKPVPGMVFGEGGFCWVAREVYGDSDPRWLQFRRWMLTEAPGWLRSAYATHGQAVAGWLRFRPVAKSVVRTCMDVVIGGL